MSRPYIKTDHIKILSLNLLRYVLAPYLSTGKTLELVDLSADADVNNVGVMVFAEFM